MKRHSFVFITLLILSLLTGLAGCDFKPSISDLKVEKPENSTNFQPINNSSSSGQVNPGTDNNGNTASDSAQPQDPPQQPVPSSGVPHITDPGMNSPWKQINAPVKNDPAQRSAQAYLDVIAQFNVQSSYPGRYRPGDATADTRCNIFAGDVMRAMGAPLPTKGELGKGAGSSKNTDPMTANAKDLHDWLNGQHNGWRKIDVNNPADLQLLREHLSAGKPAVASDPGHIAVLRPDNLPGSLNKDNLGNLHIAQAGAHNYNDIALKSAGYGSKFNPDIYIHD